MASAMIEACQGDVVSLLCEAMNRTPRTSTAAFRRRASEGVCEIDCVDPTTVAAARRSLPTEAVLRSAANVFKTLGNPGRLRILKALEGRELCVCDISGVLGLSMSGTSQQLRELRNLGAIEYRVDGKLVYYTLADTFWLKLAESVLDRVGADATTASNGRARGKA